MAERNLGDEQGGEEYVQQVAAWAASVAAVAVRKAANAVRLAELAANFCLVPPEEYWDHGAQVAFERLVEATEAEFPEEDQVALLAARAAGLAANAAYEAHCEVSVFSSAFTPLQAARLWSRLQVIERRTAALERINGRKRKR